jgi:hypothetical protein
MSISNRFSPRPLSTAETTQTGSAANIGPSPSALPAAKARGGRSSFAEKLGGFHAGALSAGLRLFSDPSVKNAMAFVKSAVTSLSGTVASAYNAFSSGTSQAAPRPAGGQVPQQAFTIDSSAFDKWVSDNKFDGAKPTPAKTADDAALRTRVSLPPAQPGSASAKLPPLIDIGAPALPPAQQPAKAAAQQPAPAAAQGLPTSTAPQTEPQVPPRTIAQDPGFAAAFDKWVQDNGFEAAKPTPAKPATGNTAHTPVTQPTTRPTAPLVDIETPVSPPPQQPAKAAAQQPAPAAAQDPILANAFDKWVQDNGFGGAKPTPAKPATENTAQTPATQPTTRPTATLAPLVDIDPPVSPSPQQPAKAAQPAAAAAPPAAQKPSIPHSVRTRPANPPAPQERPTPASVQTQPANATAMQERPIPHSVRTRPANPPAPEERPAPVSVQARPEQPAPTTAQLLQEPASPPGSPTAALLNRKHELNSSQSELLEAMSQLGGNKPSRASTSGGTSPARTQTEPTSTKPAHVEPQGEVYTDRAAYGNALDKWERDNHFDYDNPMPSGHVSEPRPVFASSSPRTDGPAAGPLTRGQAEIAAHQEAMDNGYR